MSDSPANPKEVASATDRAPHTCPRCGKQVHEGAHTCLAKKVIEETYRSGGRHPEIQNFAFVPATPSIDTPELEKLIEELENAWAEYSDWRVDSAADGIATSFNLRRLEDTRRAIADSVASLRAEVALLKENQK